MQKASIFEEERRTALELVGTVDSRMTIQPQNVTDSSRSLIGKVLKEENKKVKRIETIKIQVMSLYFQTRGSLRFQKFSLHLTLASNATRLHIFCCPDIPRTTS